MNRTVVLMSLAIVAFASLSASAVYKYEFQGFVYDLGNYEDHEIDISYYQSFTGWFSFSIDHETKDFNPYASIFVDFGNYQMASIYTDTYIDLYNSSHKDEFRLIPRNKEQGLYYFQDFSLNFEDLTGTAFDDRYLTKPLNFLDFDYIGLNLRGRQNIEGVQYDYLKRFKMTGVITDLVFVNELKNVPEPCTIAILGLGGLLLRRKK